MQCFVSFTPVLDECHDGVGSDARTSAPVSSHRVPSVCSTPPIIPAVLLGIHDTAESLHHARVRVRSAPVQRDASPRAQSPARRGSKRHVQRVASDGMNNGDAASPQAENGAQSADGPAKRRRTSSGQLSLYTVRSFAALRRDSLASQYDARAPRAAALLTPRNRPRPERYRRVATAPLQCVVAAPLLLASRAQTERWRASLQRCRPRCLTNASSATATHRPAAPAWHARLYCAPPTRPVCA